MSIIRLVMTSHHECMTSVCALQRSRGGVGRDVKALREARRCVAELHEIVAICSNHVHHPTSGVRGQHDKDRDTGETTAEDARP